ncbi:MAG: protoporphyrinogen oxidase [Ignavibacteriales bacterium]|nr:protoporphyrinogen oxidase [Ignavibacteriales bacterium]
MVHKEPVIIIGAGISGLTVAYFLKKNGCNVTVLEEDSEVGGTMKTEFIDGYLIETGPNSALETTPLFKEIIQGVGIENEMVYANETSNKRYILKDGTLHAMPMSPPAFLKSKLLSAKGKLRVAGEFFQGKAYSEESIAQFVERRLGKEFLDYFINPFVAGVFAGNPEKLSVRSAFPKLYALEEKYGGIFKGVIRGRRERKQRAKSGEQSKESAKMFSFKNGMQTLPKAIAQFLGDDIFLNAKVEHVIPIRDGNKCMFTVSYTHDGVSEKIESHNVVFSIPAYHLSEIIRQIDPEMSKTLSSIYYPPVAEVFFGFKKEQIKRELDGFGYLIPEKEKRNILGTIWSSSLFSNRSPNDFVALTTFVGGARQPEICNLDDEQLSNTVLDELKSIMNVEGKPAFTKINRWQKAIPQYELGYHKTEQAFEKFEQNFRGAFLCANFRGGISVGDCVISGERVARSILEQT